MINLWYCCRCEFGPHDGSLYKACIECGTPRCSQCSSEKIGTISQTSPKTLHICDSCLSGEVTPTEAENTRQAPHHPTSNRERGQCQAAPPGADDINLSASRSPPMQKGRLQRLRSEVRLFIRSRSPSSANAHFNDLVDDTRSQNFQAPQACSPSVGPKYSSTSTIVYSSSLGSIMVDWVYEQFTHGVYSSIEIQALENVLVELKNTQPSLISVRAEDRVSRWNTFKGNAERVMGGTLDWWPFRDYMPPLAQEQVRLCWECVCIYPSTEEVSLLI